MQRIGLGYDVHAFADDRKLIMGGVEIPHERGLLGHSDADVLTHALMDALVGALRLGDIGKLFPDTDPAYKDADSLKLLAAVGERMRELGFTLIDADCVIVAEAPKMAPYREQMRANLSAVLGVDVSQVGVKATTTEKLGFEGRGEGIAAQSVVLLERAEAASVEEVGE
jgi:2-C-methyl-D-erythritol 2,4-cyclodiphosphate synthase